jgi:hypothetical protein
MRNLDFYITSFKITYADILLINNRKICVTQPFQYAYTELRSNNRLNWINFLYVPWSILYGDSKLIVNCHKMYISYDQKKIKVLETCLVYTRGIIENKIYYISK